MCQNCGSTGTDAEDSYIVCVSPESGDVAAHPEEGAALVAEGVVSWVAGAAEGVGG